MLNEIRGTGVFKNLVQIISDVSGQHSNEIKKDFFFWLKIQFEDYVGILLSIQTRS